MPIDLTKVPEDQRGYATMFATTLSTMPTEALRMLVALVEQEIADRGEG